MLQPGSSVATALSEGEAARKHVFVLEIAGESYRTYRLPLRTVRPFVFETVDLTSNLLVLALSPLWPQLCSTRCASSYTRALLLGVEERHLRHVLKVQIRKRSCMAQSLVLISGCTGR